jgi:hypothetical protein
MAGAAGSSSTNLTDLPCTFDGFCWENPVPNGVSMNDVWGASDDDVWAVGFGGALRHFDGQSWSFQPPLTRETLWGIHGSGPNDVWAVGERGARLHFDGTTWSSLPADTTGTLRAVAVLPGGEAWIVGSETPVWHLAGGVWDTTHTPPSGGSFGGVQAFAPNDVWVANGGAAQHWDGTKWTSHPIDGGNNASLVAFEKTTDGDLYAYLDNHDRFWEPLFKWDGTSFPAVKFPEALEVASIGNFGTVGAGASDDVWMVTENGILRFDGAAWSITQQGKIGPARGLFFSSTGRAFGVGDAGLTLGREGPGTLEIVHAGAPPHTSFAGLDRAVDTDTEWVAGSAAVLRRGPGGTAWETLPKPPVVILGITSVTARSGSSVWFTTTNDVPAVFEWTGGEYVDHSAPNAQFWMNAAHTTSAGTSYFGGSKGIVRWTGTELEATAGKADGWINALCSNGPDDIWGVGLDGSIVRTKTPQTFAAVPSPTTEDLQAVHCVSANEVWISGNNSTLLRWDGTTFSSVTLAPLRPGLETFTTVLGIAGAIDGPHGLWVLVQGGEVFELHGTQAPILHQLHFQARALAFTRPAELVVVGDGAAIVRKTF